MASNGSWWSIVNLNLFLGLEASPSSSSSFYRIRLMSNVQSDGYFHSFIFRIQMYFVITSRTWNRRDEEKRSFMYRGRRITTICWRSGILLFIHKFSPPEDVFVFCAILRQVLQNFKILRIFSRELELLTFPSSSSSSAISTTNIVGRMDSYSTRAFVWYS